MDRISDSGSAGCGFESRRGHHKGQVANSSFLSFFVLQESSFVIHNLFDIYFQMLKFVNSLVDYSADGGGNIQMRVAGMRKLIHTAQSPSEFNVDEQLLKSCDWDKWDELFKDILF